MPYIVRPHLFAAIIAPHPLPLPLPPRLLHPTRCCDLPDVQPAQIFEYNGSAIVAMAGKECFAIGSDLRFGVQFQTLATDYRKVPSRATLS